MFQQDDGGNINLHILVHKLLAAKMLKCIGEGNECVWILGCVCIVAGGERQFHDQKLITKWGCSVLTIAKKKCHKNLVVCWNYLAKMVNNISLESYI